MSFTLLVLFFNLVHIFFITQLIFDATKKFMICLSYCTVIHVLFHERQTERGVYIFPDAMQKEEAEDILFSLFFLIPFFL